MQDSLNSKSPDTKKLLVDDVDQNRLLHSFQIVSPTNLGEIRIELIDGFGGLSFSYTNKGLSLCSESLNFTKEYESKVTFLCDLLGNTVDTVTIIRLDTKKARNDEILKRVKKIMNDRDGDDMAYLLADPLKKP